MQSLRLENIELKHYKNRMQKNLVIVESPAKAKTIEKFLGKEYKVMSSYGHIRDLKKKEMSIDTKTLEPRSEERRVGKEC